MNRPPYRGQIGRTEIITAPGWAVTLGAIVAGALGIAVFLASASLILMLAPVLIGAAFYVRWRVRRALRKMAEEQRSYQRAETIDIIDGDYRIIKDEEDRYRR
jgi:membrane protein implicated in regulation of membrane protease activity